MESRQLGTTGLRISVVGFGAWAIGGTRNSTGNLGPVDDAEAIASIHHALERGVNWIDTAPGYGAGHSEEIVGRALHGRTERPLVFTKCGFVWGSDLAMQNRIDAASIRAEVDASLRRLRVERIDLYQIHWVEPENDPQIEDAWHCLNALKQAGKVAHIGVSNFDVGQLERLWPIGPVETLQPPYSLLERGIEPEILPYCAQHQVGVIVYSPMQTGLLTGGMTRERVAAMPADDARLSDPNFTEPRLSINLTRVERLKALADAWGTTAAHLSVAWALRDSGVSGAIVGFRRPAQVKAVLGAPLPHMGWTRLAAIEAIGW
jgi:aryl-alcohol dehydrogenase-like predicted oxidoreductase